MHSLWWDQNQPQCCSCNHRLRRPSRLVWAHQISHSMDGQATYRVYCRHVPGKKEYFKLNLAAYIYSHTVIIRLMISEQRPANSSTQRPLMTRLTTFKSKPHRLKLPRSIDIHIPISLNKWHSNKMLFLAIIAHWSCLGTIWVYSKRRPLSPFYGIYKNKLLVSFSLSFLPLFTVQCIAPTALLQFHLIREMTSLSNTHWTTQILWNKDPSCNRHSQIRFLPLSNRTTL